MNETSIKVEKPVVDLLNSIKGLLEWKQGTKYTLNDALIILLTDNDIRYEIAEGHLDENNEEQINKYLEKRLKQFWGNNPLPDVNWKTRQDFFNVECKRSKNSK